MIGLASPPVVWQSSARVAEWAFGKTMILECNCERILQNWGVAMSAAGLKIGANGGALWRARAGTVTILGHTENRRVSRSARLSTALLGRPRPLDYIGADERGDGNFRAVWKHEIRKLARHRVVLSKRTRTLLLPHLVPVVEFTIGIPVHCRLPGQVEKDGLCLCRVQPVLLDAVGKLHSQCSKELDLFLQRDVTHLALVDDVPRGRSRLQAQSCGFFRAFVLAAIEPNLALIVAICSMRAQQALDKAVPLVFAFTEVKP